MTTPTIVIALQTLGFIDGYAAGEDCGIVLWTRDEPQPTEAELIAAGWIKPGEHSASDNVEEEGSQNAPIPDSGSAPSDN